MLIIVITCFTVIIIFLSKMITGIIFNPIMLYTFVWYFTIALNSLNLWGLKPIDSQGWQVIFLATSTFIIGALTIITVSFKNNYNRSKSIPRESFSPVENRTFIKVIGGLCGIAAISVIYDWWQIIRLYGTLTNFFINANTVYAMRITGQGLRSIPYLSSFSLAACCVAGIYMERIRKLNIYTIIPLVLVIFISISQMGRSYIIIALGLYINPFLINMQVKSGKNKRKLSLFTIIAIILLFIAILTVFNIVRDIRGANVYYTNPDIPAIKFLERINLLNPGIYHYIVGPISVFSQSLHCKPSSLGRGSLPGMQTFSPLFRLLSYTGLLSKVSYYEEAVDVGIFEMNTGTYLKDVYIDFGLLGVIVFPYFLGIISMVLFIKWLRKKQYMTMAALSFIYVYIELSAFLNIMRTGYFVIGFTVAIISIAIIDRIYRRRHKIDINS